MIKKNLVKRCAPILSKIWPHGNTCFHHKLVQINQLSSTSVHSCLSCHVDKQVKSARAWRSVTRRWSPILPPPSRHQPARGPAMGPCTALGGAHTEQHQLTLDVTGQKTRTKLDPNWWYRSWQHHQHLPHQLFSVVIAQHKISIKRQCNTNIVIWSSPDCDAYRFQKFTIRHFISQVRPNLIVLFRRQSSSEHTIPY